MKKLLYIASLLNCVIHIVAAKSSQLEINYTIDYTTFYLITSTDDSASIKTLLPEGFEFGYIKKDNYKNRLINSNAIICETPTYLIEIKLNALIPNEEYFNILHLQKSNPTVLQCSPGLLYQKEKVGSTGYLFVELKESEDSQKLSEIAHRFDIQILGQNPFRKKWWMLKPGNENTKMVLDICKTLEETNLFKTVAPDLLIRTYFDCNTTNPSFPNQWGLQNTGQNGGTSGMDINVCNAWGITKGNGDIKIAVFDSGVEFIHSEFTGNLFGGFNAQNGTTPSVVSDEHGTNVAGIIIAKDNSEGVVGISPNCKIIPISFDGLDNRDAVLADGFAWAQTHDVDIINCSWHQNVPGPQLVPAIQSAINNGRQGKGCVVVFASGNTNGPVNYPGNSIDDIVCVGAIDRCGYRASSFANTGACELWGEFNSGSNYGNNLDLVAPGTSIETTDLVGSAGANTNAGISGNYTVVNGTSFACPMVSGVAALMLSVNPNLTQQQVQQIIETTTTKINPSIYTYNTNSNRPNGTWNVQLGYGLLNAAAAVQEANNVSFCNSSMVQTASSGSFHDGSGSANYGNFSSCEWLIQPAGASNIYLWFTNFVTAGSGDQLKIYDGPNTSYPLIGTYHSNNTPTMITSSGNSLFIKFSTDATQVAQGWQAHYTTTSPTAVGNFEYWFNDDFSSRVISNTLSVSGNITQILSNASVTNIEAGKIQTLHVRAKNNNGRWSSTLSHSFYFAGVKKIVRYEYWFDNGYSNRIVTNLLTPQSFLEINTINTIVSTASLNDGLHSIKFRIQTEQGKWSNILSQYFYQDNNKLLSGYEYWYDNDYYNSIAWTASTPSKYFYLHPLNSVFNIDNLQKGFHTLNLRARSINGIWSSVISHNFYKIGDNHLAGYQYWFDDDYANVQNWNSTGTSLYFNLNPSNSVFYLGNLEDGLHYLNLRVKDEKGAWSSILKHPFYLFRGKLVSYEYWFDNLYLNRVSVNISPNEFQSVLTNVPISSLALGSHEIHVRFKDNNDKWSSTLNYPFCKGLGDSAYSVKLFIEGYYTSQSEMRTVLWNQGVSNDLSITDSIDVQFREEFAPHSIIASKRVSLKTNGLAEFDIQNIAVGYYFLVVKHRNGIETWSSDSVYKGDCTFAYDFTTAKSNAFGDNQKEVGPGVWAFYSGDINQDENINLDDLSLLDIDVNNFASGYFPTDINGDGNVDLDDILYVEANNNNFIFSNHP